MRAQSSEQYQIKQQCLHNRNACGSDLSRQRLQMGWVKFVKAILHRQCFWPRSSTSSAAQARVSSATSTLGTLFAAFKNVECECPSFT